MSSEAVMSAKEKAAAAAAERKAKQEEAKRKREEERAQRERLKQQKDKLRNELGYSVADINELIEMGVDLDAVGMKRAVQLGFPYPFKGNDYEVAGKNLGEAFNTCQDESLRLSERVELASAIMTFAARCPPEQKEAYFTAAMPQACDLLKKLVGLPDDDTGNQPYDKVGLQKISATVSGIMRNVKVGMDAYDWCLKWAPYAFQVLDVPGFAEAKLADSRDRDGDKCATHRATTALNLLNAAPPTHMAHSTGEWTIGDVPDPLRILHVWEEKGTTSIQQKAQELMKAVVTWDKEKASQSSVKVAVAGKIVQAVLAGDRLAGGKLAASMYEDEPKVFEENILALFEMAPMYAPNVYYQIGLKHPQVVLPATDVIVQKLASGKVGVGGIMWLNLLQHCATADATRTVVFMTPEWLDGTMNIDNAGYVVSKIIGLSGKAPGKADDMVRLLCRGLRHPHCSDQAFPGFINEINNLSGSVSSPRILDDDIEYIRSKKTVAAALVEKVEDWYAGRSLAAAYDRLDELEEMILQMNDKVSSTCANFEEVKAYVDQNMAEMKEFVATIAKKLPQPVKLTVVTGIRKTLRLHFACVRTGDEWTCETKDWNKWMKVGFSVMKLGKCVLDIGMGNPLGLVKTGVDALSGIYKAFKDKDDEEFDKYISEPFLTSAESDKLINQLRDGGFFEQFAYDAQAGGWVSLKAVSQEERDALTNKRDQKIEELKQNKETVKGKNLGFGSASDIAKGAVAMAKEAGVDVVDVAAEQAGGASALVLDAIQVDVPGDDGGELLETVQGTVVDKVGGVLEDKLSGDAETSYGDTQGTDTRKQKADVELKSVPSSSSPAQSGGGGGTALDRAIARRAAAGKDVTATAATAGSGSATASRLGQPVGPGLRDRMTDLERTIHKQQQQLAAQEQRLAKQEETLELVRAEVEKMKKAGGGAAGACCVVQ